MTAAILFWFVFAAVLGTTAGAVYYSFRVRRRTSVKQRGLDAAKTNVCMGAMLIASAVWLLFWFSDSALRRAVGTLFVLLGLFNLFVGLRNHGVYRRLPDPPDEEKRGGPTSGP